MGQRTTNDKGDLSASTAVKVGGREGRYIEVHMSNTREEEARARAMVKRRTDKERLERTESERLRWRRR